MGGRLATVEQRHFWRPSVFDRWRMTLGGLQRAAPDFALQLVGDTAGHKTIAVISQMRGTDDAAGAYFPLCEAIQGSSTKTAEKPSAEHLPKSVGPPKQAETVSLPAKMAPVKAAHGLHPAKQVPPTPDELAHILSELPKGFTKGLLGSDEKSIKDLDTLVWALD
jgi:hypothetical protein